MNSMPSIMQTLRHLKAEDEEMFTALLIKVINNHASTRSSYARGTGELNTWDGKMILRRLDLEYETILHHSDSGPEQFKPKDRPNLQALEGELESLTRSNNETVARNSARGR